MSPSNNSLLTLKKYLSHEQEQHYQKDELIYRQGDLPKHLYFIVEGVVKTGGYDSAGEEFTEGIFHAGELVGEMALFQPIQHRTFALALHDDTIIRKMDLQQAKQLMESELDFYKAVMEIMVVHRSTLQRKLEILRLKTIKDRVISLIIDLIEHRGFATEQGYLVKNPLIQADLASLLSTSRQTVCNAINQLKRNKLITVRSNEILVSDLGLLKKELVR
jgi:CRP-like cAMP-binding protein